ncbi:MAG: hypothetical protein M3Y83_13255 [Actinomycetota bacterium]|nr:hypothetical protein [Actinomycetota bacterium]
MNAVMGRAGQPSEAATSSDQSELDVLEKALVKACDDVANTSTAGERSAAYRKGYTTALRFARICVLDQIASAAIDFTNISGNGDGRSERDRSRTLAALGTISQRLSEALRAQPEGDVAAGYRAGIRAALVLTEEQERAVQRELGCATLTG